MVSLTMDLILLASMMSKIVQMVILMMVQIFCAFQTQSFALQDGLMMEQEQNVLMTHHHHVISHIISAMVQEQNASQTRSFVL